MNRFLRWKTPPVEPVEYTRPVYNNGSLPPRILTIAGSVWLKPGKTPTIRPGLYIQGEGKNWYLVRDGYKHEVLVNGQPYMGKHLLQDGDFVQWKNGKFIYQSDPVADNYDPTITEPPTITLNLGYKLRQQVIVTTEGITVDGGKHVIAWDDLYRLEFQNASNEGTAIHFRIYTEKDSQGRLVSYKLKHILTANEFDAIWGWIMLISPAFPSIFSYPPIGMDAYYHAAFLKIFEPAEQGIRSLPATKETILDTYTAKIRYFYIFLLVSFPVACAAIVGIHHRFFIALVVLYSMTFIFWLVSKLDQRTKRKQNPLITFNSNKDM